MREFLKKVLVILLTLAIVFLVVGICAKAIVINTLSNTLTKSEITSKLADAIYAEMSELTSNEKNYLKEILNDSEEINQITDIYFNAVIYDIENDTISTPKFDKEIDLLINKTVNTKYQEDVKLRISKINFNEIYVNILNYVKSITNKGYEPVVTVYSILTNNIFLIISSCITVLNIILLILINKPKKTAVLDLGISFMLSGGIIMIIIFIAKRYGGILTNNYFGKNSLLSLNLPIIICVVNLVGGFIMLEVYDALKK